MSVYHQVAENLNKRGILPHSARQWSVPLIQQVVYGKIKYEEVSKELKKVMAEEQRRASKEIGAN